MLTGMIAPDKGTARYSQITNQNGVQATSGFEICFAIFIGS